MVHNGSHSKPQGAPTETGRRAGGAFRRAGSATLIICLVLLVLLSAGGTLAWLSFETESVTNSLEPGSVPVEIGGTFDAGQRSGVTVKNIGNSDAYIRVAIVANALDANGNIIAGTAPAFAVNTEKWQLLGDYYYYKGAVSPGESTAELFTAPVAVAGGELNVLAESIQTRGGVGEQMPEQYAWGVTCAGGSWS